MELCPNGDLFSLIKRNDGIENEFLLKTLFIQLCNGVSALHSKAGYAHLNLRPEKILISNELSIKICDLSLAVEVTKEIDAVLGTDQYMTPEPRNSSNKYRGI